MYSANYNMQIEGQSTFHTNKFDIWLCMIIYIQCYLPIMDIYRWKTDWDDMNNIELGRMDIIQIVQIVTVGSAGVQSSLGRQNLGKSCSWSWSILKDDVSLSSGLLQWEFFPRDALGSFHPLLKRLEICDRQVTFTRLWQSWPGSFLLYSGRGAPVWL